MVKSFLRPLGRWPAVEAMLGRVAGRLRTWPDDDLQGLDRAPAGGSSRRSQWALPETEPLRQPQPISIAPATFERWFMKLHLERRFDEMWEMLAQDAQRAWGGREAFKRDMPRLDRETELLDMQVVSVSVLESWMDEMHGQMYTDVARLVVRYRIRQQWKELTFDRQVHLIPAAEGWRTLCYPPGARASVTR
ncbi:MAG: hypothetical protein M3082_09340 [Candidatus Dormibacteraeota bacterium]|nr:hypothetical protein [Candidatus Dormibacteraeota bacterium]